MWGFVGKVKSAAATAAQGLVHSLTATRLDDFKEAWKSVDEEFNVITQGQGIDDPKSLSDSKMVTHLNTMVEMLVEEEEEEEEHRQRLLERQHHEEQERKRRTSRRSRGKASRQQQHTQTRIEDEDDHKTGPCFEYLLKNNIVDKLCALGLPDRPPGMRKLITKTLDAVFHHTRNPLINHMTIHQHLKQFVQVCYLKGDLARRQSRKAYIEFLRTLCAQLREQGNVSSFFEEHGGGDPSRPAEFVLHTALMEAASMEGSTKDAAKNTLTALEGLEWIAQLPDPHLNTYIANHTAFASTVIAGLASTFERVSKVLSKGPKNTREPWGSLDPDTREGFTRRFDYTDRLLRSTYPVLTAALREALLREFLHPCVSPLLCHVEEQHALFGTALVTEMVRNAQSAAMQTALAELCLGELVADDNESNMTVGEESAVQVQQSAPQVALVGRVDGLSEDLSRASLSLFDALLSSGPGKSTVVPRTILGSRLRGLPHVREDERGAYLARLRGPQDDPRAAIASLFPGIGAVDNPSLHGYLVDSRRELASWQRGCEEAVAMVLTERVEEKSSGGDSGGDHNSSSHSISNSAGEANDDGDDGNDKKDDATATAFEEGPVFSKVLDCIDVMFSASFEQNLLVTSVIRRLALAPVELLPEYILDPSTPLKPGVRSVLGSLSEMWKRGQKRATRMEQYKRRLAMAKERLRSGGDDSPPSSAPLETLSSSSSSSSSSSAEALATGAGVAEPRETERFLQAMLVLSEFVRELCAIATARKNLGKQLAEHERDLLAVRAAKSGVNGSSSGRSSNRSSSSSSSVASPDKKA